MLRRLKNKIAVPCLAAYLVFFFGVPQSFVLCLCPDDVAGFKISFLDTCNDNGPQVSAAMNWMPALDEADSSCRECNACSNIPLSLNTMGMPRLRDHENNLIIPDSTIGPAGLMSVAGSLHNNYLTSMSGSLKPPCPDLQALKTIVLRI